MTDDYEVTAVYMSSLIKAMQAQGMSDRVLPALSPEVRAMANDPFAQRWWPAKYLEVLTLEMLRASGPAAMEELAYHNIKKRIGPLVTPMLRVAMALSGASPASLLSRLDASVKVAMRGFEVAWTPSGEKGGVVEFRYPRPVASHVEYAWRGVFRFVFEVSGTTTGRVERFEHVGEGRRMRFTVAW